MTETPKKPCIQERIKTWFGRVFFNPSWLFCFAFIFFIVIYITTWLTIPTSIFALLENLDYNRAKDIVNLLVTTNVAIIAFTGVISSMLLRHILQQEKTEKETGYSNITDAHSLDQYKRKRRRLVRFIMVILLLHTSSIAFCFNAILAEYYVLTIFLSLILLFIGLIELAAMLIYSLEDIHY